MATLAGPGWSDDQGRPATGPCEEESVVSYRFISTLGAFDITLNPAAAPATCAYFRRQFAQPQFVDASVFRIVTGANSSVGKGVPIEVVQLGLDHAGRPLDQIAHEGTDASGLTHDQWAVSAARFGKGEVYPSCFICMRDEPALDHGGSRQPDGEGFAVFGRVTSGFDTLRRIFACAGDTDYLSAPIPLTVVHKA
ncbi:peptidylprolyl isomerase [Citromicrobium bathyomarinum]